MCCLLRSKCSCTPPVPHVGSAYLEQCSLGVPTALSSIAEAADSPSSPGTSSTQSKRGGNQRNVQFCFCEKRKAKKKRERDVGLCNLPTVRCCCIDEWRQRQCSRAWEVWGWTGTAVLVEQAAGSNRRGCGRSAGREGTNRCKGLALPSSPCSLLFLTSSSSSAFLLLILSAR